MKEFWKSVKNWQSYCHEFGVQFFWPTLYIQVIIDSWIKFRPTPIVWRKNNFQSFFILERAEYQLLLDLLYDSLLCW